MITSFSSWDSIDEIIDPNSHMPIPSRLGGAYALYAGESELAAELGTVVNTGYCFAASDEGRDFLGALDPTGILDAINSGIYAYRGEYASAGITALGIVGLDALKELKYYRSAFAGHNGSLYEVMAEYAVDGTTRGQHRNQANRTFYEYLRRNPDVESQVSQFLLGGGSVTQQMRTFGGRLNNPFGTEWHHPFDRPGIVQLMRREVHRDSLLYRVLHPWGGFGGFWRWY